MNPDPFARSGWCSSELSVTDAREGGGSFLRESRRLKLSRDGAFEPPPVLESPSHFSPDCVALTRLTPVFVA